MSQPTIEPYLFFSGTAEEAIDFYVSQLGAKLEMKMRFSESPDPAPEGTVPAGFENKIMHASIMIGNHRIMISDGCESDGKGFHGFSLSLSFDDEATAKTTFNALSEGGEVTMPMDKTFWSPCFGMLKDKFGVGWMVNVNGEPS